MMVVPSSRHVEIIKYDKEKLEKVKGLLNTDTPIARKRFLIKTLGYGICSRCEGIPTHIITYDLEGGGKLIQRSCDRC